MLTDPQSVTYNGSAKSLVRKSVANGTSVYGTTDSEFEMSISRSETEDGLIRIEIKLERVTPDPTPSDVFDDYRRIPNRFGFVYEIDPNGFFSAVDIPLLRAALIAHVDTTLQGRLLGGEL